MVCKNTHATLVDNGGEALFLARLDVFLGRNKPIYTNVSGFRGGVNGVLSGL